METDSKWLILLLQGPLPSHLGSSIKAIMEEHLYHFVELLQVVVLVWV
jgi:hypothetical protein